MMALRMQTNQAWLSPYEKSAIVLCMFVTGVLLSKQILMSLGISTLIDVESVAIGAASAIATYSIALKEQNGRSPAGWRVSAPLIVLLLATFLYLGTIYLHGITLPANDPVADVTYSSVLAKGKPLSAHYHVGENGNTYPPGAPLLLSIIDKLFGHIALLYSFKWLCIFCVGITPLAWAWAVTKFFDIKSSFFLLTLAFYISAFCVDRTLNYTLPFAGKNSQILMLAAFPAFIVLTKRIIDLPWHYVTFPAVLLTGLIFIHYSAIHLAFAVLSIFSVYELFKNIGDKTYATKWLTKSLAIGVIAIIMFVILLPSVIHNAPSTFGAKYSLIDSFKLLIATFFEQNNSTLAIFNTPNFQSIGSPLRGYVLITSVLTCLALRQARNPNHQNEEDFTKISNASICLITSLFLSIALGSGLINAGVNLDYSRWFSFPLQFSIIACPIFILLLLAKRNDSLVGKAAGFMGIILLPFVLLVHDTQSISLAADAGILSSHDIRELENTFVASRDGCIVVSPSRAADSTNTMFSQEYRPLEYLEMSTNCTIINGSWVHGPSSGLWRDGRGLPFSSAYQALKSNAAVYFVGSSDELAAYGGGNRWKKLSTLSDTGASIWLKM